MSRLVNKPTQGGQHKHEPIRVASFFSGIGGFDLGFEKAGMEVVFQSEINSFCRSILQKHWPHVKLAGDIRNIKMTDIPTKTDVWCAGFPCQDVSLANQGKRAGLRGERSGLFFAFASLVKNGKPRFIVLENVVGLLNSNDGQDFQCILETLDELGYICAWRIFDAQYFGTPQRRRRVIIVASLGNASAIQVLLDPSTIITLPEKGKSAKQSNSPRHGNGDGESNIISVQHGCIGRNPGAGPQGKGWRRDGKTWTLDSRGTSDVVCSTVDPFRMRDTPRISEGVDGSRYRSIGNAVPVQITTWLGKRIMRAILNHGG